MCQCFCIFIFSNIKPQELIWITYFHICHRTSIYVNFTSWAHLCLLLLASQFPGCSTEINFICCCIPIFLSSGFESGILPCQLLLPLLLLLVSVFVASTFGASAFGASAFDCLCLWCLCLWFLCLWFPLPFGSLPLAPLPLVPLPLAPLPLALLAVRVY